MSYDPAGLKVKKDAAVTALFSLYKAAGDASSAVFDLIDYLQNSGFDTTELKAAFGGAIPPKPQAAPATPAKKTRGTKTADTKAIPTQATPAEPVAAPEQTQPAAPAQSTEAQGETEDKPKRAKRVKDPNAPKRPLNSFLKFRNLEQKRISQDRKSKGQPELARDEMIAAVKSSWENLPQSARDAIDRETKEELQRYHANLTEYKANNNFAASQGQDPEHDPSSQVPLTQEPLSQVPLSQEPLSQEPFTQESATQEGTQDSSSPSKRKPKRKDDKEKKKKKSKAE